jgi:UDP-N-acetylglucosamine/UDP-N-acetylgalactosamine diphosphorylase
MLDALEKGGVTHLHVHSVDNAMAIVPDPILIGFTAGAPGSPEVGCKAVRKTRASEKIGVFAKVDGSVSVLEYSEIPSHLVGAKDEDGSLKFSSGNVCNHVFTVAFVRRMAVAGNLRYHRAFKKIPVWDWITQEAVQPPEPNG